MRVPVKSAISNILSKTLGAPILWLGLGVVAICASLGLSYLRAQVEADHALALRKGPPQAVAVEQVSTAKAGEGHIVARFHPEQAITVRFGSAGARSEWLAVPLFSAGSPAPAPAMLTRPRPRPSSANRVLSPAAGLAVFPRAGPGPEALLVEGAQVFEGALNGPHLPLENFGLDTAAAFAEAGVALPEEFVAIRPWVQGRAAALAPPPPNPLSRYLLWSGILAVLGALALSLKPDKGDRYLTITPDGGERKVVTKSRILADTNRFNPIVGQDDIRRGAMERLHESERSQGRTPSTFVTNGPAGVGAGWVKNRR